MEISYLSKYVDDIFVCMGPKRVSFDGVWYEPIDLLKHLISVNIPGMPITHEIEGNSTARPAFFRYLNMTLFRTPNQDGTQRITTKWSMQPYASGRVINAWSGPSEGTK